MFFNCTNNTLNIELLLQSFLIGPIEHLTTIQIIMLCTVCRKEFDQKFNTPRLLILCGHSLCESCCYRLHSNSKIDCPQCKSSTYIESISLLPKNLALIIPKNNQSLCGKHKKKYQAFCEKQNILICIECILQDGHKNHEMDSIKNAFEKHNQKWSKKIDRMDKQMSKLKEVWNENKKCKDECFQNYSNVKESVAVSFKELRQILDREEEVLLAKFQETYNQSQMKFEERNNCISDSLQHITSTIEKLKMYDNSSEITFLQNYSQREELYTSINLSQEEVLKATPINFSKKSLVENVVKQFQNVINDKQKKINQNCNYNTIVNYSSTNTNSFKKNNDNGTIKGVRKAIPVNTIQNKPNTKKISSAKKQITSAIANAINSQRNDQVVLAAKTSNSRDYKTQNPFIQIASDLSAVDPKQSLCLSFMSNMTSFLSEKRSIYLIGGFNDEANNIVKVNLQNFQWEQICLLNSNRSKFGSIALEKQIVIFGGKKGKERVSDSQIFNLQTSKWNKFNSMNKSRSGFGVISVGDLIYFIGGNDGDDILNTVETLNIKNGEWRRKQSMNQARDELAVIAGKNGKIYAIGGFGGTENQPLRSVQMYDIKTDKWKLMPDMNQARRALAAAYLADGIYAIGGFDGNAYMSSVQRYQQGDREWVMISSMKEARCTHSAVSLYESQQIFVFGGFDYVPLDSVERYNVISNEWEIVCTMPNPRFMHSSILVKEE